MIKTAQPDGLLAPAFSQPIRAQVLPAAVDSAGEVVLTVVVSSMVVARGEVTRVVVVTFTLVDM